MQQGNQFISYWAACQDIAVCFPFSSNKQAGCNAGQRAHHQVVQLRCRAGGGWQSRAGLP